MGLGFDEDVSQRSDGPPSCTGTSASHTRDGSAITLGVLTCGLCSC